MYQPPHVSCHSTGKIYLKIKLVGVTTVFEKQLFLQLLNKYQQLFLSVRYLESLKYITKKA